MSVHMVSNISVVISQTIEIKIQADLAFVATFCHGCVVPSERLCRNGVLI